MKNYEITVNGKVYQVAVKEIDEATYQAGATKQVAVAAPVVSSGTTIKAPMPGVLLKMKVAVGEEVKSGQLLCLLEAMKMENEIVAPEDGVVSAIHVTEGAQVEADAPLISL